MRLHRFALIVAALTLAAFVATAADFTGLDWEKLSDRQKTSEVTSFIKACKKEGVTIGKGASFYVTEMDDLYYRHKELKKEPAVNILKTLMIMEYDWDKKGVDKDTIAKDWLGDALYKSNKERIQKN